MQPDQVQEQALATYLMANLDLRRNCDFGCALTTWMLSPRWTTTALDPAGRAHLLDGGCRLAHARILSCACYGGFSSPGLSPPGSNSGPSYPTQGRRRLFIRGRSLHLRQN